MGDAGEQSRIGTKPRRDLRNSKSENSSEFCLGSLGRVEGDPWLSAC